MPNQQIIDYIKKSLKVGFKEGEIRDALEKTGWPREQIDESFASMKKKKPFRMPSVSKKKFLVIVLIVAIASGTTAGYFWWQGKGEKEVEKPKTEEEVEMSDSELSTKAVNDKNSSLCEKIKSEEKKDNCYRDLVMDARMGNPTFCQKIVDSSKKESCYYSLALVLHEIEYCRLLTKQYEKDQCIKWAAIGRGNSDYCSEIKEKENFRDDCYATIACNTRNPDLCKLVKNEEKRAGCEKYSRDPIIAQLHVYDEQGRHTGPVGKIGKLKSEADFKKLQIEDEIPGTYIYTPAAGCSMGMVWIYGKDPLIFVIEAFDEGRAELVGSSYDTEKEIAMVVFFEKNIYLKKGGRASLYLNPHRNPLLLLKVDTDGDGITDLVQEPNLIKCTDGAEKEVECPQYGKDADKDSYADSIDTEPSVYNPDQAKEPPEKKAEDKEPMRPSEEQRIEAEKQALAKRKDAKIVSAIAQSRVVMEIIYDEDGNYDNFNCSNEDMKVLCATVSDNEGIMNIVHDTERNSQNVCMYSPLNSKPNYWYCTHMGAAGFTEIDPESNGYCVEGSSTICPEYVRD